MQAYRPSLDGQPALTLRQETDTATPQTAIPIYLIHSLRNPFCNNPACICQREKQVVMHIYQAVAGGEASLLQTATVSQRREPGRVPTVLIDTDDPCQLYGHSWQAAEGPDVKECSLCHVRGYCPGCTPFVPPGAAPFYCTRHAQDREVQE